MKTQKTYGYKLRKGINHVILFLIDETPSGVSMNYLVNETDFSRNVLYLHLNYLRSKGLIEQFKNPMYSNYIKLWRRKKENHNDEK